MEPLTAFVIFPVCSKSFVRWFWSTVIMRTLEVRRSCLPLAQCRCNRQSRSLHTTAERQLGKQLDVGLDAATGPHETADRSSTRGGRYSLLHNVLRLQRGMRSRVSVWRWTRALYLYSTPEGLLEKSQCPLVYRKWNDANGYFFCHREQTRTVTFSVSTITYFWKKSRRVQWKVMANALQ